MKKLSIILGLLCYTALQAQDFTAEQYKKAAWMATRFYGAQRSGIGPNWLTVDESRNTSFVKDQISGKDVSGGWFDCGDHVMFGQTQYYTIYALLKAYDAFPEGFYDLYSYDYSGYKNNQNFNYGYGTPNGVPDLIDELRYAIDFVFKATGPNFFVYQKGNAKYDHSGWWTPPSTSLKDKESGGERDVNRPIYKNPNDGAMASMASAALAAASRIMRPFYGHEYADALAINAKYAYDYGAARSNTVGDAQGDDEFYNPNASVSDNHAIAAAEMYFNTGDPAYKTRAEDLVYGLDPRGSWSLDYENEEDLAVYAVALMGGEDYQEQLRQEFVEVYTSSTNNAGVGTNGNDNWGELRYPLGQAFVAGLYSDMKWINSYDKFIYDQVDYVLGSNSAKRSFVVGFCEGCVSSPQHPHHRGIYQNNNNPSNADKQNMQIPDDHKQFGALVGGSRTPTNYEDKILAYESTEVCIDYNVGLVASLGYILSRIAPTTPNKDLKKSVVNPHFIRIGDQMQIGNLTGDWKLNVADLNGKIVFSKSLSNQKQFVLNIGSPGVYTVLLYNKTSQLSHRWINQ